MAVAIIAVNFDRKTNPHPNPTDFAHDVGCGFWLALSYL